MPYDIEEPSAYGLALARAVREARLLDEEPSYGMTLARAVIEARLLDEPRPACDSAGMCATTDDDRVTREACQGRSLGEGPGEGPTDRPGGSPRTRTSGNPDEAHTAPTRHAGTVPTETGTLDTVSTPRPDPHQRDATTKPYNVRLTVSLVAEALDRVQLEALEQGVEAPSLARLIDRLLQEYLEA